MGWKINAPKGFDNIHRILGAAMREAGEPAYHARPHLGGALPVLSTRTQLHVAIEIGTALRGIASAAEKKDYDKLLAVARSVVETEKKYTFDQRKAFNERTKSVKSDSVAIRIARYTARTAYNELFAASSARNAVGVSVENAAVVAIQHYAHDGTEAMKKFLQFVDDAILRCELTAFLTERALKATSPIAKVVSRPKATKKGGIGLVLAKLADGRFGLYAKLKQKWEWHEGDRETVFATVPDAFMEHVIMDLEPSAKSAGSWKKTTKKTTSRNLHARSTRS